MNEKQKKQKTRKNNHRFCLCHALSPFALKRSQSSFFSSKKNRIRYLSKVLFLYLKDEFVFYFKAKNMKHMIYAEQCHCIGMVIRKCQIFTHIFEMSWIEPAIQSEWHLNLNGWFDVLFDRQNWGIQIKYFRYVLLTEFRLSFKHAHLIQFDQTKYKLKSRWFHFKIRSFWITKTVNFVRILLLHVFSIQHKG